MIHGFASDVWGILTGKSKAWYTKVSNLQDYLAITLAGVTSVGQDMWDTVSDAAQGPSQDDAPVSGANPYSEVTKDIQGALAGIVVTDSHVPTDESLAWAKQVGDKYQSQLSYVQQMVPEVSAQVRADQAATSAALPAPMNSPSAVAKEVFVQEVSDRAAALVKGLGDLSQYLAWAAGFLFLAFMAGKFGSSR